MRRNFLLITGLFVLGMLSGCPMSETSVTNAAKMTEEKNIATTDAVPVSTPHKKTARKYSGVAVGNRKLWTESVSTPNGFDRASRAAILFYALEIDAQKISESKSENRPSVIKWLEKESNLALQNYQSAAKTCQPNDWTCVGKINNFDELIAKTSALQIPENLNSWQENMTEFVGVYVAEMIHLANVFPRTTSEIDLFNDNEWDGDKINDRKFFLTFDDGPTAANGNTDNVLLMLAAQKKSAVFFVLGRNFAGRQKSNGSLAKIYEGQCVGAHGWEHISHEKRSKYAVDNKWQTSVTDTINLLKKSFDGTNIFTPLFRPPYGQRKADSGAFFQSENLQVALWNLDSQDWNSQVSADDVVNRMEILMLIKRRGVLLFHDIHPKAHKAVPTIISDFGSAIEWGDCHQIAEK